MIAPRHSYSSSFLWLCECFAVFFYETYKDIKVFRLKNSLRKAATSKVSFCHAAPCLPVVGYHQQGTWHQHFMCGVHCQLGCDNSIVLVQMSPLMSSRSRLILLMSLGSGLMFQMSSLMSSVALSNLSSLSLSPRLLWEAACSRS